MGTFYTGEEVQKIGLGHVGENVLISRNAVIYSPKDVHIGSNVRIDDFAVLSGKITLSNYIHIAQFCGLWGGGQGIFMEDYTSLSSRVSIYATSDDYSGESMTNPTIPDAFEPGHKEEKVVLEKFVAVGASSVILPGCTLRLGGAFSAMSLVLKNTEEWTIYAGIPARRVGNRSKKILELEKQFILTIL